MADYESASDDDHELVDGLYEIHCVPELPALVLPAPWIPCEMETDKSVLAGLADCSACLFDLFKAWYEIDDSYNLVLTSVAPDEEWRDSKGVFALAMRRLQALHHVATSSTDTTTLQVASLIYGTLQAISEAHARRLLHLGQPSKIDRSFALLLGGHLDHSVPSQVDDSDPEFEQFKTAVVSLLDVLNRITQLSRGAVVVLRAASA